MSGLRNSIHNGFALFTLKTLLRRPEFWFGALSFANRKEPFLSALANIESNFPLTKEANEWLFRLSYA